ncbi:hypothetical protein HER10_EVM0003150 [Colletotrichum scovillei]|nr:uncharacterized protein HER10_EVM0003150 [Colletotrichum scovillei]KAF4776050.1 hypothetical protein HER10_EVM0003150 [Colletotrichum scovillei]
MGSSGTLNVFDSTLKSPSNLPYFELSWSPLSTVGALNVLLGFLVVGITSFSKVAVVPIVSSAAGAIANGLCYYAYYDETYYPLERKAVVAAFGDFFWMVQEAGLPFYSYIILRNILRGTRRKIFTTVFWLALFAVLVVRVLIIVFRVEHILRADGSLQSLINGLHIGYFCPLAMTECVSAYFLLGAFAEARAASAQAGLRIGFVRYLVRSTEVRLATLAVTGVMRTVTHSLNISQSNPVTSYADRVAYTLECFFPVIMYVDLLASRLQYSVQTRGFSFASDQALRCLDSRAKIED